MKVSAVNSGVLWLKKTMHLSLGYTTVDNLSSSNVASICVVQGNRTGIWGAVTDRTFARCRRKAAEGYAFTVRNVSSLSDKER